MYIYKNKIRETLAILHAFKVYTNISYSQRREPKPQALKRMVKNDLRIFY